MKIIYNVFIWQATQVAKFYILLNLEWIFIIHYSIFSYDKSETHICICVSWFVAIIIIHKIIEARRQKPSEIDGRGWKEANNTLMAYVCDVPRSQQALLSWSGLCAELAKCFGTLKRFKMTVKLLRKLITPTRTSRPWLCCKMSISFAGRCLPFLSL